MSTRRLDKRAAAVKPELKRAGSSIESQSADLECSICMTAYRAVRLRPCGHASSCALCTLKLIDAKSRRIQCPLCKAHAKQLEWVGLPVVTSAEELPVTLSAGAASLTLSVACVEAPAPPPPLVRLDTFSKAPAGEATTVVAFVRHAAMAPSAEDGLNAEASRLLESWAGAPQVKEDLHFAPAEVALRGCIALRRGEAVEPPRLRLVLRPALASIVYHAEAVLRECMALLHCEAV